MKVTMLRLRQLNEMFGISVRTWREYIKKGELKAKKVGKAYYVTEPNPSTTKLIKEGYAYGKKGTIYSTRAI